MPLTDNEWNAWLSDRYAPRVVLLDLVAYSGGALVTRRVSNYRWVSGPADNPANTAWLSILLSGPEWAMNREGLSGGAIVVHNGSGALDAWLMDAWDGRAFTARLGGPRWPLADFRVVRAGTIEGIVAADSRTITFSVRDRKQIMNDPLQSTLITTGPNENNPAPVLIGRAYNIEPVLIDQATRTYQIHDGALQAIIEVRDNGSAVTITPDLAQGKFSLNSPSVGRITCDAVGYATGAGVGVTVSANYLTGYTFEIAGYSIVAITEVRADGAVITPVINLAARTLTIASWPRAITADITVLEPVVVTGTRVTGATYFLGSAPLHAIGTAYVAGQEATKTSDTATGQITITSIPAGVEAQIRRYSPDLPSWVACTVDAGLTYSISGGGPIFEISAVRVNGATVAGFSADHAAGKVTITDFSNLAVTAAVTRYTQHTGVACSHISNLTWEIAEDAYAIGTVYADGLGVDFTGDAALDRVTLKSAPIAIEVDITVNEASVSDAVTYIATRPGKLAAGDIDAGSVAAFRLLQSEPIGLYIRERRNAGEVLDEVMAAVGGFWFFGRSDKLKLWRLDPPGATYKAAIGPGDIREMELYLDAVELPAKTVRVGCRRNWTPQDKGSLLAALTADEKESYASEYLLPPAVATNAIGAEHPKPLEPDLYPSLFVEPGSAALEANRRAGLLADERRVFRLGLARLFDIDMGDVVRITHPRFGFATGKTAVVIGLQEEWRKNSMGIIVWL